MSTLIFMSSQKPEKGLIRVDKYKAYLSPQEKENILKELEIAMPGIDDYIISMHVEIELKKYDTKNTGV